MKSTLRFRGGWRGWLCAVFFLLHLVPLAAQNDEETQCNPTEGLPVATGEVFVNYGAVTNTFSFQNRSNLSLGQPLVERTLGQQSMIELGYWSRFLLPPQPPITTATQGDFADRIQLNWSLDPLSAGAGGGFIVLRDGAFLAELDAGTRQFIDFNVQPGEFYEYSVQGVNEFGTGTGGRSVGFTNPNGVVTGRITSRLGNPLQGATITVEPTVGRSLQFNGEDSYVCLSHDARLDVPEFTFSAYIRLEPGQDRAVIIDRGRDLQRNFWITTAAAGADAGAVVGLGSQAGANELAVSFPADDPYGWHHLALVYAGGNLLAYVDAEFAGSLSAPIDYQAALFTFGQGRDGRAPFAGALDDVRLYDRYLTQTELSLTKDITASRGSEGLVAYWKFDEGIGDKVFDTGGGDIDGKLNGVTFSEDAAPVRNGAFTDAGGYYMIEGINYSDAQSFKARPSQNFYYHSAIEFNATRRTSVRLPEIDFDGTGTLELTVKPFVLRGRQNLLHTGQDNFALVLDDDVLKVWSPASGEQVLDTLDGAFTHIALQYDAGAGTLTYFANGNEAATVGFSLEPSSGSDWTVGAHSSGAHYFTGLIGEVAMFDTLVGPAQLQVHASTLTGDDIASGVDPGDANLQAFYAFDEGAGTTVDDFGPNAYDPGQVSNGTFSIYDYRQRTFPHEYRPSERVINLNGSATAVSGIDFTDESTIPVSGVVRFSDTYCYQDSVQILADGYAMSPPVFTDERGHWSAEFEPGASFALTPDYPDSTGGHTFGPPFYEIRNIARPVAGVLFQNTVKRTIVGQVAGGACRMSINDPDLPIRVKVESLDGCYSETVDVDHPSGRYKFTQVPPIPVAVSVVQTLPAYRQLMENGGQETDLRYVASDTIDFIYYAPPQVEISEFTTRPLGGSCGNTLAFIEASYDEFSANRYTSRIKVYEEYENARCYLSDSLVLRINNEIADAAAFDTIVRDTNVFTYTYPAGIPNFAGNNRKKLEVTATNVTGTATALREVVVTGRKTREGTFTTTDPLWPLYVLRAPPGDQSFATIEKGETKCTSHKELAIIIQDNTFTKTVDASPMAITQVGFGLATEYQVEAGTDTKLEIVNENRFTTEHERKSCTTFLRSVSTATGADVPHGNGDRDVYIGIAANINLSNNDYLYVDTSTCTIRDDSTRLTYDINAYETEYFYSQWQLKTDVIPSLRATGKPEELEAANTWEAIIAKNAEDKASGILQKNYTFDGLVSIQETAQESNSYEHTHTGEITAVSEFAQTAGISLNSAGTKLKYQAKIGATVSGGGGESEETSSEVSFVLADDDPNDNFTVDILKGKKYPGPIFKLRAGESMCPWEPGTRNREEVGFNIDRFTALNIPETQPAVFKLQLTNEGQTGNDAIVYTVGQVKGSNPDGAVLRIDGASIANPRSYQILPGEVLELTLTVNRGPEEFNYDSLGVFMASACMYEHAQDLGYDLSNVANPKDYGPNDVIPREGPYARTDLNKFYKEFRLNVEFVEPCTPIDIDYPRQDWVVTPEDNNRLPITVVDYDYDDPDLDTVRLQYRSTGGDGNWINITKLPADSFATHPVFRTEIWDMEELRDGPYEIRATATCSDLNLAPGISTVIQGRKETEPPRPLGAPQPADGILSPDDEISITWTKRIDCGLIFPADGIGTNINVNNLALIDKTTGELVKATISCRGEKIVIVPDVANRFIENRTLGVVVNDIQDLYGNESDSIHWEFYVNRSNLAWTGGAIDEVVAEGESRQVTRKVRNQSGQPTSFTIPTVPDWMEVFPRSGDVAPGEELTITFAFPGNLIAEAYRTDLILRTVDGEEPLDVGLRVACSAPPWSFDPAGFDHSMNLTVEIDIEGALSTDRLDLIAAYVGNELRGLASIRRQDDLSSSPSLNPYLAFLTVYSNQGFDETVRFEVWDASTCLRYGETAEQFPFQINGVIGEPLTPQTIHTTGAVAKVIPIRPGWNWISHNLTLPDSSLNGMLASLTQVNQYSLFKSQTKSASYSENLGRWFSPPQFRTTSADTMYQYKSTGLDSLQLVGYPVDPTRPIPVVTGWNWIGYLPARGLPVNVALNGLHEAGELVTGDVIKSQTEFAQYVPGLGWLGSLRYMSSPNGYQIRLSAPGQLRYPDVKESLTLSQLGKSLPPTPPELYWQVDANAYEFSMNLVAVVTDEENTFSLREYDELGAFIGDELRGGAQVQYFPELKSHLIFLTVFGHQEGDAVTFRYYDRAEERELDIRDEYRFGINEIVGRVDEPAVLTLESSTTSTHSTAVDGPQLRVYPNPADDLVHFEFTTPANEAYRLRITDALGRTVDQLRGRSAAGMTRLKWRAGGLSAGIYQVTLELPGGRRTVRLTVQ